MLQLFWTSVNSSSHKYGSSVKNCKNSSLSAPTIFVRSSFVPFLKILKSYLKCLSQWLATGGQWAKTGIPAVISSLPDASGNLIYLFIFFRYFWVFCAFISREDASLTDMTKKKQPFSKLKRYTFIMNSMERGNTVCWEHFMTFYSLHLAHIYVLKDSLCNKLVFKDSSHIMTWIL